MSIRREALTAPSHARRNQRRHHGKQYLSSLSDTSTYQQNFDSRSPSLDWDLLSFNSFSMNQSSTYDDTFTLNTFNQRSLSSRLNGLLSAIQTDEDKSHNNSRPSSNSSVVSLCSWNMENIVFNFIPLNHRGHLFLKTCNNIRIFNNIA